MKCKLCNNHAEAYIPHEKIFLCREHFCRHFEDKVSKTIKEFNMFSKEEEVVVAVSGGKDSLTLMHVLDKLGYRVIGYHIDLRINGYSKRSKEKVINFSEKFNIKIDIDSVSDHLGLGIIDISKKTKRAACSICGMVKRYLMNRKADEKTIATGHNLDDEAAVLLSNLLNWNTGFLNRQYPVLDKRGSLAKKVKPFVFITELETSMYAFFNGIDYIIEECPLAEGATSIFYKNILSKLEEKYPGSKLLLMKRFINEGKRYFNTKEEKEELKPCIRCGYLTVAGICSFCRLKEKLSHKT